MSAVISSPRTMTTEVTVYGVRMTVEYLYEEGESPIFWPTEQAHPGAPPSVQILSCKAEGNIYDLLSNDRLDRIEEAISEQLES